MSIGSRLMHVRGRLSATFLVTEPDCGTHTHGMSRVNSGTEVETDAQLEVWAHNRDLR